MEKRVWTLLRRVGAVRRRQLLQGATESVAGLVSGLKGASASLLPFWDCRQEFSESQRQALERWMLARPEA